VLAAVPKVEGVVAARIAGFALAGSPAAVDGRLPCRGPTLVGGTFTPAELLSIDPATLSFAEMKP
jgi:hypothetical protein